MNKTLIKKRVEDLVPFDRNSRTHGEAQIAQLAASIKEFGFTSPILIDEANTILAGEGRWGRSTYHSDSVRKCHCQWTNFCRESAVLLGFDWWRDCCWCEVALNHFSEWDHE